jgi:8-oxo-dGTP diphosphatase
VSMTDDKVFWRHVAALLKKMPWLISGGRLLWSLGRARFSAGVAGVLFNEQGQLLLVEHVFHPHTPWGLPGGWIDRREDPTVALRREFHEELELDIHVGNILITELGYGDHLDFAYLCSTQGKIGKLSNELLSYRWFDVQHLPRMQNFHYRAIMRALEIVSVERKL